MYSIRTANKQDLDLIAEFISNINSKKEYHIGFCGTNIQELSSTLENDESLLCSFVMIFYKEGLIGLLGFDYYDNVAELWGPFVEGDYDFNEVAQLLWDKTISKLAENTEIQGFVNEENLICMNFYTKNKMWKQNKNEVLEYTLNDFNPCPIQFLSKDNYGEFIKLHDKLFPKTYYQGEEIVNMLNSNNVVLVSEDEGTILGYGFVNIDEVLEGSIEYIGVNTEHRRKGHGATILNMALSWFKEKGAEKLTLCVGSDNSKAVNLYKKIGFKTRNVLYPYYIKK